MIGPGDLVTLRYQTILYTDRTLVMDNTTHVITGDTAAIVLGFDDGNPRWIVVATAHGIGAVHITQVDK